MKKKLNVKNKLSKQWGFVEISSVHEMKIFNLLVRINFLAHLAKGNVSYFHHLVRCCHPPVNLHIWIFSSETP
jgi:hypothetical protein